jgi:hypothetical protein
MKSVIEIDAEIVKELFLYDSESGGLRHSAIRQGAKHGEYAGQVDSRGYIKMSIFGRSYRAHRVVWLYHYGEWPASALDHINGNRTDNRIENLRLSTASQNSMNTGVRQNATSGAKGIHWRKDLNKWRATITASGRFIHLGYHDSKDEAAHAYNKAAIKYHGEFAVLNPF